MTTIKLILAALAIGAGSLKAGEDWRRELAEWEQRRESERQQAAIEERQDELEFRQRQLEAELSSQRYDIDAQYLRTLLE